MTTRHWVLLTMTVDVQTNSHLVIVDREERLTQYRSSLRRWCEVVQSAGAELVILENSQAAIFEEFGEVLASVRQPVHGIQCPRPGPKEVSNGKGAMEAAMLDYGISALELPPQDLVTKVTGRLVVPNFRSIHPRKLDLPSAVIRGTLGGGYVDTRVLSAHGQVWRTTLFGMGNEVDDDHGRYLEHVVSDRLIQGKRVGEVQIRRFRRRPVLVGVSGTSGRSYSNFSARTRRAISRPIEAVLRLLPDDKEF